MTASRILEEVMETIAVGLAVDSVEWDRTWIMGI